MKNVQPPVTQIELTLVTDLHPRRRPPLRPYQRRRQLALRWFQEMHRAVDNAIGRSVPATGRAEQVNLALVSGS